MSFKDLSDGARLSGDVRNHLFDLGYQLGIHKPPYNSVNSITKVRDALTSHSDPRGGGLAARLDGGGGGAIEEAKTNAAAEDVRVTSDSPQYEELQLTGGIEKTGSGLRTASDRETHAEIGVLPDFDNGTMSSISDEASSQNAPPIEGTLTENVKGDVGITLQHDYDGGRVGTGNVVKGDKRGGVDIITKETSSRGDAENSGRRIPLVVVPDNVVGGDYHRQRPYPSQVRVDAPPVNAWGSGVPLVQHPQAGVLPPHVVHQIQQHLLQQAANAGLPVRIHRSSGGLAQPIGSDISGRYSEVPGVIPYVPPRGSEISGQYSDTRGK